MFFIERHPNRHAAQSQGLAHIAGIGRVRDDNLIAGVQDCHQRHEDPFHTADGDHDIVHVIGPSKLLGIFVCHCLTHGRKARLRSVLGPSLPQSLDTALLDVLRRFKIGLAIAQVNGTGIVRCQIKHGTNAGHRVIHGQI